MREPGVSGQCQIVPCGMKPSTKRNIERDETRLQCGTTQAKKGCEYLLRNLAFTLQIAMEAVGKGGGWH